jgi:hypothetical protein
MAIYSEFSHEKMIFHSYVSLPEGTNLIFPASKKVANHKQVPGMASPSTFVIFEATDKKKTVSWLVVSTILKI